jgi:DNA-binding XRE family transcriptional regulator
MARLLMRLLSVDYSLPGAESKGMSRARDVALIQAFSVVLREERLAVNVTQEQLAHDADVDRTYIGLLELAKRQPSLSVLFSIAKALNIAPEILVRRTSERAGSSP